MLTASILQLGDGVGDVVPTGEIESRGSKSMRVCGYGQKSERLRQFASDGQGM